MHALNDLPRRAEFRHPATVELALDLGPAENEAQVEARFQSFAEDAGFTDVVCIALPPLRELTPDCILMNTRPKAWCEEYFRRDYARSDPVLRELAWTDQPFTWSGIARRRRLSSREQAVMEFAAEFGMRDGLAVPIFDISGNIGLVSAANTLIGIDGRSQGAMTLAAVCLYNKLCALRHRQSRPVVRLTDRELEVMRWIAAGKSDWQVGQILDISAKTVNYHVENVKRKYGVASRMQAAIGAFNRGRLPH